MWESRQHDTNRQEEFSERNQPTYLIITDNYGIPVFYRKSPEIQNNFKKLRGGNLSYYLGLHYYFEVIDSSYNVVDQIFGQNGYFADQHELEQLDNGHYLLMCYDAQPVRCNCYRADNTGAG